jgi:hypothetical protein
MKNIRNYFILVTKARKNVGENYSFIVIIGRLLFWLLKYKGGFSFFFMLNLHKKGSRFDQILSHKEFHRIHDRIDPVYYRSILEDKYIFDCFMKGFNYPLAPLRGIVIKNRVRWLNEERTEPIEALLNYELNCYCKMITKWGGQDVHKLEIHKGTMIIDNELSDISRFKTLVSGAPFVLQNTLIQHAEMNRLNHSCVNTIRAITIHNGDCAINFINYLRLGVGNSIVDNISHGGLGCRIYDDGTLAETANDKNGFNTWLTYHPDSKIEFKGFKIPFFKEALDIVVHMHERFHCFFTIGWDIAITETGPVIIEANPVGSLWFEQTLYGGIKQQFLKFANSYIEKRIVTNSRP